MSSSVFETPGTVPDNFKRWDIPVKMGIILGLISIVFSVINFMFIMPLNYIAFLVVSGISFLAIVALYYLTGVRQRKAVGGFITIKDAFSAIFVAILISSLISTIWGVVYAKWIDPTVTEKVKESTLAFMERMKVPQEKLDSTAADLDKQLKSSMEVGVLFYNLSKGLVMSSLFGFICAAIVKRAPKQQML